MAATKNAAGGKGPWGGHAVETEVSARAWPARPDPTHPDRRKPVDKVRQLQRRLWVAAKQQPERRFHALYDRICEE